MQCEYCKKEFESKKKKAKFCSPKCRVYASRELQKRNTEEPELSEDLLRLIEEYENLYLKTKAPTAVNARAWEKYRTKRLEELKSLIKNQ